MNNHVTRICLAFVYLFALMLAVKVTAATPILTEFWISTNATGNLYPSAPGTIDSPLDGSTQANFDSNMNGLPANSTIHVLAGTYQTKGIAAKTAQKILGSGIDVTILQFPSGFYVGGSGAVMIADNSPVTNTEICDLTCDCNVSNNTDTYSGIDLVGTQNAVRRVKVINLAKFGGNSEAWGIELSDNPSWGDVGTMNNIIEQCEISHFHYGGSFGLSAITISGGSGVIRNNRVILQAGTGMFGFNGSDTHDVLIEGNYVEGASTGVYGDTGGTTNLIVAHNSFINCWSACNFHNTYRQNITFAFNNITLTNSTYPDSTVGIGFYNESTASYTNIFIFGNNVRCSLSSACTSLKTFVRAFNVMGLAIDNNAADSSLTNFYSNCSNINADKNTDLFGNYRYDMNIPTVGNVPVSSLGYTFLGASAPSVALMAMGLPPNPAVIVTNYAGVVAQIIAGGGITTSTTMTATGQVLTVSANIDTNDVVITFAPTNGVGWYRLTLPYYACEALSGDMTITRQGLVSGSCVMDLEFNYTTAGYYTDPDPVGNINVLRYYSRTGPGITALRIGNFSYDGSHSCGNYVDVYDNDGTSDPFTIRTHGGTGLAYLLAAPVFMGVTNMPQPTKSIRLDSIPVSENRIQTSGSFIAGTNNTLLTDASGLILNSALPNNITVGGSVTAGSFSGNGSGLTGLNASQAGAAAATNAAIYNSVTVTNPTAAKWATISVTSSNALIQVNGVTVAVLQTNGVLNAPNGLSTTISNTLAASSVSLTAGRNVGATWTNVTPENVVAYVSGNFTAVGYNGSLISPAASVALTLGFETVMLKPGSYLSVTNQSSTLAAQLYWHPF